MHGFAGREEFFHEAREGGGARVVVVAEAVGPPVRQAGHALAADLHRLLQVRVRGAEPCDLGRVGGLRDLLAAGGHVAPVRVRGRPGQRVFLVLRAREEGGAVGEGGGHGGGRDAVVVQVEKARGLEGVGDLLRGGVPFGRGAVLEGAEVDELKGRKGGC